MTPLDAPPYSPYPSSAPASEERSPAACRCVLLVAEGDAVPASLVQAMSRRGFLMTIATDAPAVILELAETRATALIIVDPERHPQAQELVTTVRQYFPRVALWQAQTHGDRQELTAIQPPESNTPTPDSNPEPHLAVQPTEIPHPPNASPEAPLATGPRLFAEGEPGPIVTKDELAMLLGSAQPDRQRAAD